MVRDIESYAMVQNHDLQIWDKIENVVPVLR
jgi:hypothetical protein